MTTLEGKVAAVTGAGSGIGRALSQALVDRGAHVAVSDVDEKGLAETVATLVGATNVTSHRVDVRDRADVESSAADVKAQHGGADIIINNAGVTSRASIEECSYEDLEFVLGVNLWGVIHATKAFFPLMRERGGGHIVNISSINAFVPFPLNGPYNISKYAVHGLSETLMQELAGDTIHVTSVHPGGVKTNIANRGRHMPREQAERFNRVARTAPEEAARVILDAVENNRERVFVGADAKVMAVAKRAVPASAVSFFGWAARRAWGAPLNEESDG
jgi:NAD(P)-dependent dehydrogenase (short-subunit alcohol dehydrogenase family)